jgi:hypothetical protein
MPQPVPLGENLGRGMLPILPAQRGAISWIVNVELFDRESPGKMLAMSIYRVYCINE